MCNYKLTVTISKSTDIVDGGGWATGMTWRKTVILEESERTDIIALRDLLNGGRPATDDLGSCCGLDFFFLAGWSSEALSALRGFRQTRRPGPLGPCAAGLTGSATPI